MNHICIFRNIVSTDYPWIIDEPGGRYRLAESLMEAYDIAVGWQSKSRKPLNIVFRNGSKWETVVDSASLALMILSNAI